MMPLKESPELSDTEGLAAVAKEIMRRQKRCRFDFSNLDNR
jgi:hypothetical protein